MAYQHSAGVMVFGPVWFNPIDQVIGNKIIIYTYIYIFTTVRMVIVSTKMY